MKWRYCLTCTILGILTCTTLRIEQTEVEENIIECSTKLENIGSD
jgi:hypothetical protein